jgi:C-terminal processing protease CtpA/Prc
VLAFSIIAGSIVHIRLKNWHYAYRINQLYDKNLRLSQEYAQIRLEMARYQNPENLLERLKEMNLSLEGIGMTTQPAKAANSPAVKAATKNAPAKTTVKISADKTTQKITAKPAEKSSVKPSAKNRKNAGSTRTN